MKKFIAILMVFSMISVISVSPAFAATNSSNSIVTPQYEQICEVDNGLNVDGKTLLVYGATFGYSNATKCGVTATLQKQSGSSWVTYRTWSATSSSSEPDYVQIDTTLTVASGKYRLLTSHYVTVNGYSEYENIVSPTRTVS